MGLFHFFISEIITISSVPAELRPLIEFDTAYTVFLAYETFSFFYLGNNNDIVDTSGVETFD